MPTPIDFWQKQNHGLRVAFIDGCKHEATHMAMHQVPLDLELTLDAAEQRLNDLVEYQVIIVGVTVYPIRRRVIGELRRVNSQAALIFLRLSPGVGAGESGLEVRDQVIADIMLSSNSPQIVWQAAESLCPIFPFPASPDMKRPPEASLVEKAVRVISMYYTDPSLNLHRVADKLGLSAGQLSRILNKHAGMRFRQLLQQTRLEAAKQMLAAGNTSIKEVAYSVGFSDSDYFSRAFKRYTGDCATTFKGSTFS
ncbi:MAG TPA: helix-turn-helix transcriptional regulator [Acidobacteriota bacterium]|nr:helix-turn-helix transcriptional regulator [Acidobacteriota bacterium]HMZ80177.1 helix-turn-helix transcriptional regulator [Acidobacteriota bacterium]HNB69592.1 helix-turn-helix transcriptional regulator [Acidobacteriota bacterium]HND18137.1 helix-turn-helix transcriptional regulator [Acidobacteriota bacterium]HNG91344.1 helix-turn-helix transcriptional regulator [Acidobacteriota bacterium]